MKKLFGKIVIIATVLVLCFSLCSCKMLDDIKESHAYWCDDYKNSFELNGDKYYPLDLKLEYNGYQVNYNLLNKSGYITNKEVPHFVAEFQGTNYDFGTETPLASVSINSELVLFCRSDEFNKYNEMILNGDFITDYCYDFWWTDGFKSADSTVKVNFDFGKMLKESKKSQKLTLDDVINYEDRIAFYPCSGDVSIVDYWREYDIWKINGRYYYHYYDYSFDDSYDGNVTIEENEDVFAIPDEYYKDLDEIFTSWFEYMY